MRVKEVKIDSVLKVEAIDNKFLFKHCTLGRDFVSKLEYKNSIERLLYIHNAGLIEYIKLEKT